MSVNSRLKHIENQLGVGHNICRTVLILGPPRGEDETKADGAEHEARIERSIQEAIRRSPKCPFFFLLG